MGSDQGYLAPVWHIWNLSQGSWFHILGGLHQGFHSDTMTSHGSCKDPVRHPEAVCMCCVRGCARPTSLVVKGETVSTLGEDAVW